MRIRFLVSDAFAGTLQGDGHFTGIAVTQAGSGSWSAQPGDTSSVEALCGSYSRCPDPGCALPVYLYPLSLVVAGGSVSMATFGLASGEATVGTGTATASSLSFDFEQVHADGDLSPGSASGTWADSGGSGYTGIWSASTARCPLAAR